MSIHPFEGPRTYFVLADVEPKEVMNFGVTAGIPVGDAATIEVLGHMLAFWTPSAAALDFDALRVSTEDLFAVTLAIDALLRLEEAVNLGETDDPKKAGDLRVSLSRRATVHSWLEVREFEARANVIGTVHTRYRLGQIEMDGADALRFRVAARGAWAAIRHAQARLAFKDYALSLTQRGEDAFLYAYRAIESVRRSYADDQVNADERTTPVWPPMHEALGTNREELAPLTNAATCIRHGQAEGKALVEVSDEPARERTLKLADDVLRRFARDRQFID